MRTSLARKTARGAFHLIKLSLDGWLDVRLRWGACHGGDLAQVDHGRSLIGAASPASLVFPETDENSFAGFYGPSFAELPAPLTLAGAATALSGSRRVRQGS
jgi:hypothetical protein